MIRKLTEYIKHPETLDAVSLQYLEGLMVQYPYFQTVHLLYLQNLKRLNDSRLEEQLHISALYIFDRRILYQLLQNTPVGEYVPAPKEDEDAQNPVLAVAAQTEQEVENDTIPDGVIRFESTVNEVIPEESAPEEPEKEVAPTTARRTPSPLEATTDYMQYLLQMESESMPDITDVPLEGQGLIDSFLEKHESDDRMYLGGEDEYEPIVEPQLDVDADDGIFTETLASIYIKQGRYLKAIEIIRKLSLKYPKKNRYFADQIRYLEKLIITNKK
jgi:hypothetical protein